MDACSLAGVLKRNLLLTPAEAAFFRIRWSVPVLEETQTAIEQMLVARGVDNAGEQAAKARQRMEEAFEETLVADFDHLPGLCDDWPDPGDAHVVAAALTAGAATIVTDNLKDRPSARL